MNNTNRYRTLTLLHSNDMHGDFLAENIDEKLVGGVSLLSGYINKVREDEENVLYCVAGDMFRGSVIDSEYQGISTIEIMNMLAPDIVTIGNHETDYGLAHLLFIEKCAKFPIINANLHIKMNGARLFEPYRIIEIGGMKILFIGILTEEVINNTKTQDYVGSLVDIEDAARAISKICNTFNGIDIDFTVLLTHIGFEEDKKLAAALDPALGVDVIIGGHSHTFIDEPAKVNDILIVQAGTGTDQIGRFDIVVDTDTNSVASYKWQAVPINNKTCPKDNKMEELVGKLKSDTDLKYGRVLRKLKHGLNHESRYKQTELGSLFADIFKKCVKTDIVLLTSGGIRVRHLDATVTLQDLMNAFPFKEQLYELVLDGKTIRKILELTYTRSLEKDAHNEFFQLSDGMHVVFDTKTNKIVSLMLNGKEIEDDQVLSVCISSYIYKNIDTEFGLSFDDINKVAKAKIIATNHSDVLYEFMESNEQLPKYPINDRVEFK